MVNKLLADAEERMKKALEAVRRELSGIRTGKATPQLLDTVRVEAYGQQVSLKEVGQVSAPEPRLLVIQPWDKSSISAIEKAIMKSELGLTPSNDGTVIRITLPQLTEERRRDLVKVVHRRVEDGRVAVRNVRREAHDDLRDLRKENMATEDDLKQGEQRLQRLTDNYVGEADRVGQRKEAEVLEV